MQAPFAQSSWIAQLRPGSHAGQVLPPQSTSVSSPFFTQSLQGPASGAPGEHPPEPPVPCPLLVEPPPSQTESVSTGGPEVAPPEGFCQCSSPITWSHPRRATALR